MAELAGAAGRRAGGEYSRTLPSEMKNCLPTAVLLRVGRQINTARTLDEIAGHVAGDILETIDVRLAAALLVDGPDLILSAASRDRQDRTTGRLHRGATALDEWSRMGAPNHMTAPSKGAIAAASHDLFALLGIAGDGRGHALPLRHDGVVIGSVYVDGPSRICPGTHDWDTLSELVQWLSYLVGNALLQMRARLVAERRAAAEERERLARDLHDTVTQSLYGLVVQAEAWKRQIDNGALAPSREQIIELGELGSQALREARLAIYELRTHDHPRVDLLSAVQHRLDHVERRAGMTARLLVTEGELAYEPGPQGGEMALSRTLLLPPHVASEVLNIIREALNNVIRHAAATHVDVTLTLAGPSLSVTVRDNGRGFSHDSRTVATGFGLTSMRERAERLGGRVIIASTFGEGTIVRLEGIPVQPAAWSN